ncbi:hypothetical protein L2E82_43054 [Cichorium intybus]|uniref:Uncharacterized protein n=1 Tax=Cichorium intybus TaxID=13427 RepID=A0ACB8ZSG3_CICIN|nr:hypothetical protein L2E82_43054 [Cichorium intybus]
MIQSARDLQTYVVKEAASANDAERFVELSLMVHPDKCPYLEANQAFIKLNKALKDLQDPVKLELKAMHEAPQGVEWFAFEKKKNKVKGKRLVFNSMDITEVSIIHRVGIVLLAI